MRITGKIFVVTGGGNGIGRELVLALLQRGARVAAVDVSAVGLEETAGLAGGRRDRLSTHACNIADRDAVAALPAAVIAAHGAVDGLINNAGIIQPFVRVKDLDFEHIDKVMNVNFYGLVYMTKAFLPVLLQRPEGHIVNVSSMGGFLPVPGQTVYGASKAAVKLFTEGLHSEMMDTQVRITAVFPGAIGTNIAVNSGVMTEAQSKSAGSSGIKMTPAPAAAAQIIDAMEANAYHVFVGNDSKMMDKLCRLMPERAAKLIYSRMRSLLPT